MSLTWAIVRECLTRRISPIELAGTDPLTGAFNRLAWEVWGKRILGVAHLAVDLDGFKRVNDTLGHSAGDVILSSVGRILRRHERRIFRIGGDEFVLLAQPHKPALKRIARDIVEEVASLNLGVTASVGVGESYELADRALYEVKRAGKNGVRMSTADTARSL